MVAIVIPTMNRSDFLIRQLRYYAQVGSGHSVYIGDSSEGEHIEATLRAIGELGGKLKIVHRAYPGLNDIQATCEIASLVEEPYAAFISDDDFFIPNSLDKCEQFLGENPDYSSAHGVGVLFGLRESGPRGDIEWVGEYAQHEVAASAARQRLVDYLHNYYPSHFSVHKTDYFRLHFGMAADLPERNFWELLPCCMTIARGKAKKLNCLYLIRQAHDQRYLQRDLYDAVNSRGWAESYAAFQQSLSNVLMEEDGSAEGESQMAIKQAFGDYLSTRLVDQWAQLFAPPVKQSEPSALRRHMRRVPGLGKTWRTMRYGLARVSTSAGLSLEELSRPSSPYYADFEPIRGSVSRDHKPALAVDE